MARTRQTRRPKKGGRGGHFQHPKGQRGDQEGAQNQQPPEAQAGKSSVILGPRLAEADVGITQHVASINRFSGLIKERHSDFQVNEIDLGGNIVKLTSWTVPRQKSKPDTTPVVRHDLIPINVWDKLAVLFASKASPPCSSENQVVKDEQSSAEAEEGSSADQQPSGSSDKVETADEKSGSSDVVEFEVTHLDKDSRRAIHSCIKNAFGNSNSDTIDREGKKFITITQGKDKRRDKKYLHFIVHKRNMDTSEAVMRLSDKLRCKAGAITYAGTKDKRAVTSQLMCLRAGDPNRLIQISKKEWNLWLGNFVFKDDPLHLGDLKGNLFRIAIRKVTESDEVIEAALSSLREKGFFINYFGLQRFGSNCDVPTYEVGKLFLQGEWEKAVDTILQPRREGAGRVNDPVFAACTEWQSSRDASKALEKLVSGFNTIEGTLLVGLSECQPNDYVGALSSLARNMRSLYLHAYQSFIWNKVVSRRIKEFGLKPMVGDLVIAGSVVVQAEDDGSLREDTGELRSEDDSAVKQLVRFVTEETLSMTSIEDIVLPLPGYDTIYPRNVIKTWYAEILKEDGLQYTSFAPTVRQYSLRGAYRSIVSHIKDLSWNIVHYDNPLDDLILTDFDEMRGKKLCIDNKDATYKAVVMKMTLGTSCYATMALREVLKTDIPVSSQVTPVSDTVKEALGAVESNENDSKSCDSEVQPDSVKSADGPANADVPASVKADDSKGTEPTSPKSSSADKIKTPSKAIQESEVNTSSPERNSGSKYNFRRRGSTSLDVNSPEKKKVKAEDDLEKMDTSQE